MRPLCTGCNKHPDEIEEYVDGAREDEMTPDEYVIDAEGTYNEKNGHFHCTECYEKAGCPSAIGGWVAP